MYIFQIFLTIGGGTKFIPLTGVTLPLISYGGSSVMTTLILFSIIQGIWLRERDTEEKEERRRLKTSGYYEPYEDDVPEEGEFEEEDWDGNEYEEEYDDDLE